MADSFIHAFTASEAATRTALAEVMSQLRAMGLSREQRTGIEIALAEAVNNVVEHAYADMEAGPVVISARLTQDGLELRISDQGRALPEQCLPTGIPANVSGPLATLPEGGFGWYLIRTLTRDVCYRRESDSNLLILTFDLSPDAGLNRRAAKSPQSR